MTLLILGSAVILLHPRSLCVAQERPGSPPRTDSVSDDASVEGPSVDSNPKFKEDLYNRFKDNLKANPPAAYEAGKEYLDRYAAADGPSDKFVAYITKWVANYEKLVRYDQLRNAPQPPGVSEKDPYTYVRLAASYEHKEYAKLRHDYEANCKTDEQLKGAHCVEIVAKVNDVLDLMIDALARAVFYSKSGAQAAQYDGARAVWMEQLTALYEFRHNYSHAGLDEYIAGVTSKPLPKP